MFCENLNVIKNKAENPTQISEEMDLIIIDENKCTIYENVANYLYNITAGEASKLSYLGTIITENKRITMKLGK
jgi:hypothetical protein